MDREGGRYVPSAASVEAQGCRETRRQQPRESGDATLHGGELTPATPLLLLLLLLLLSSSFLLSFSLRGGAVANERARKVKPSADARAANAATAAYKETRARNRRE